MNLISRFHQFRERQVERWMNSLRSFSAKSEVIHIARGTVNTVSCSSMSSLVQARKAVRSALGRMVILDVSQPFLFNHCVKCFASFSHTPSAFQLRSSRRSGASRSASNCRIFSSTSNVFETFDQETYRSGVLVHLPRSSAFYRNLLFN